MPTILRLSGIVLLLASGIVLVVLALTPDGVYGALIGHGDARRSVMSSLSIALIQGAIAVGLVVTIPLRRMSIAACWIGVAWAGLGACIWAPLFISALVRLPGGGDSPDLLNAAAGLSFAYVFAVLALAAAASELGTDSPPVSDDRAGGAAAPSSLPESR